jgi:imidazolonepropionase-like amidohydrolase
MRRAHAFTSLVAALFAAALPPPARGAAAETPRRYVVVRNGERVGTMAVEARGDRVAVDFRIDDNGRGPKLREAITLGPGGLPVEWRTEGSSEAGAPVSERYAYRGGRAEWKTLNDAGSAEAARPPLYVPNDQSFWDLGVLARAALDAGGALRALPSGDVKVRKLRDVAVGGPRTAYALTGLDVQPYYVLLDPDRSFFAWIADGYVAVDEAQEAAAPSLVQLARDLDREFLGKLARELARRPAGPVYVRDVRVFDAARARLSAPTTVVFYGNRVASVRADAAPPPGAVVVEGEGGTVLPGLYDMHAHMWSWAGALHLAAGVTSARDPGNDNGVLLALTERIEAGDVLGPRVARSGFIEGRTPFSARGGFVVDRVDVALEKVRWYADHGYGQIKLYNSIDPEWVKPIAAEAHRLGLTVHGHVPAFMTSERAIRDGYDEITHVNQLMLSFVIGPKEDTRTPFRFTALGERVGKLDLGREDVRRVFALMKERGTALDPTLATFAQLLLGRPGKTTPGDAPWLDHMPPSFQRSRRAALVDVKPAQYPAYEASWKKLLEVVRTLEAQGTPILPGTDDMPGFALESELEAWVAAGIAPARALQLATLGCARYLGQDQERGTVERGRLADFFLVDGDPTRDISALRKVRMVVKDGAISFPEEIHRALGIRPFAARPRVSGLAGDAG